MDSGLDETNIVVDVLGLGMSGYEASDYLRAHHRLCVELHDRRRVMAVVTLADDAETLHRLVEAFRDLARQARPHNAGTRGRPPAPLPRELVTDCVMRPRDAYFRPAEHVPLAESEGRIAAENPSPYPPAIAVVVCGERITRPIIEYLGTDLAAGAMLADTADESLETIRVVANQ